MEALLFLLKGYLIGISVAVPIGPISLLVINRTLSGGWSYGAATGLGAALADMIYGLIAALGLTAISDFLIGQKHIIGFAGGIFLCFMGARTFRRSPQTSTSLSPHSGNNWKAIASSFLLCLTSPMTILSFIAIFAGAGLIASEASFFAGLSLALGVFLGAASWHIIFLSGSINLSRQKLSPQFMMWLNWVSAILLCGFGLYSAFSSLSLVGKFQ